MTDDFDEEARAFLNRPVEGLTGHESDEEIRQHFARAVEARSRLIAEGEARHEEWLRETGIGAWFDAP